MKHRKCTVCGKSKLIKKNFYYDTKHKVFASRCKDCARAYAKKLSASKDKKQDRNSSTKIPIFQSWFRPEIKNYAGNPNDYIKFMENKVSLAYA